MHTLYMVAERCMSVKSKNEPNIQCPYNKKYGDFCGVHHRSKEIIRIDQNSSEHRLCLNITFRKPDKIPLARTVEPEFYDDLDFLEKTPVDEMKYPKLLKTMVHFNIQITGSKAQMVHSLIEYIKNRELIQSAYEDTSLCNNTTDFFDFVELDKIPKEYLFIFLCADGRLYGMDLRSLNIYFLELEKEGRLMEKPVEYINPYNRYKLTSNTICDYRKRLQELVDKGQPVKYPEPVANPEDELQFKVLEIFHIISNYGYAVDASLFLRLDKVKLIALYGVMDEIWNHRFGLSISQKKAIVGDDVNLFTQSEFHQIKEMNKLKIQEILINHFEKMITNGTSRVHRIDGIHYVLLGLGEICENACLTLQ